MYDYIQFPPISNVIITQDFNSDDAFNELLIKNKKKFVYKRQMIDIGTADKTYTVYFRIINEKSLGE